jgi:hypothetical protein
LTERGHPGHPFPAFTACVVRKRQHDDEAAPPGRTIEVTAVRPDADALETLAVHILWHGQEVSAAIESMTGARFVHDTLEFAGWDVAIGEAAKVKGIAPLAARTDKIDTRVLAELARASRLAEHLDRPLDPRPPPANCSTCPEPPKT